MSYCILYKPITTCSDLIAFQNDVDTIGHWSLLNHLSLNTNKTKFMLISRSKHANGMLAPLNTQLQGLLPLDRSHDKFFQLQLSEVLTVLSGVLSYHLHGTDFPLHFGMAFLH